MNIFPENNFCNLVYHANSRRDRVGQHGVEKSLEAIARSYAEAKDWVGLGRDLSRLNVDELHTTTTLSMLKVLVPYHDRIPSWEDVVTKAKSVLRNRLVDYEHVINSLLKEKNGL